MALQKPTIDLKKFASKQVKRTITLKDNDGETIFTEKDGKQVPKTMEITMQEPSWPVKLRLTDLSNVGNNQADRGEYVAQLLEKVLVNPRMSFEDINKDVEEAKLDKKVLEYTGNDDKQYKIHAVFPDCRTAINILDERTGANGAFNMLSFIGDLCYFVFRDSKGHRIDMDTYWDDHGGPYGATSKAIDYLNECLNVNGNAQIIQELDLFFQEKSV